MVERSHVGAHDSSLWPCVRLQMSAVSASPVDSSSPASTKSRRRAVGGGPDRWLYVSRRRSAIARRPSGAPNGGSVPGSYAWRRGARLLQRQAAEPRRVKRSARLRQRQWIAGWDDHERKAVAVDQGTVSKTCSGGKRGSGSGGSDSPGSRLHRVDHGVSSLVRVRGGERRSDVDRRADLRGPSLWDGTWRDLSLLPVSRIIRPCCCFSVHSRPRTPIRQPPTETVRLRASTEWSGTPVAYSTQVPIYYHPRALALGPCHLQIKIFESSSTALW